MLNKSEIYCISLELYKFKHKGHCAAGWDGSNTFQGNIEDCFKECSSRKDIGFFAFTTNTDDNIDDCSCYFSADGCPDDDTFEDFNAYHITDHYEFKHKGHCAAGWDEVNSFQQNLDSCFLECYSRPNIGFFSFTTNVEDHIDDCSCFFSSDGCPDDDQFEDFDSYRILKGNPKIF